MIPYVFNKPILNRFISISSNLLSMMTRYQTRRSPTRTPHLYCNKGITMRNNLIYYLRSTIFLFLLLSILPQKTGTHYRNRTKMTTYWNYTIQCISSTSTKHYYSSIIRSYRNLSPPCHHRKQSYPSHNRTNHHSHTRNLFYFTPSLGILRSLFHYLRFIVRINLLHSHRISRNPRNHRFNLPHNLSNTLNFIPLFSQSPLWIRSSCMILTLCRCSVTLPLHKIILMR
jgi:hypothetical protein